MAGRAMLAIAVSSEASASAVKIAATAQRLSSGGRPSIPGWAGGFAVVTSDILIGLSTAGAGNALKGACTTDTGRSTGTPLHDAYAKAGFRGILDRQLCATFRPPRDRLGLGRIAGARSENGRSQAKGKRFGRTGEPAQRSHA